MFLRHVFEVRGAVQGGVPRSGRGVSRRALSCQLKDKRRLLSSKEEALPEQLSFPFLVKVEVLPSAVPLFRLVLVTSASSLLIWRGGLTIWFKSHEVKKCFRRKNSHESEGHIRKMGYQGSCCYFVDLGGKRGGGNRILHSTPK